MFSMKGGIHINRPLIGALAMNVKGIKFTVINSYTLMGEACCECELAKIKKMNKHTVKWAVCFWVKELSKQEYGLELCMMYLPKERDVMAPASVDYKRALVVLFTGEDAK